MTRFKRGALLLVLLLPFAREVPAQVMQPDMMGRRYADLPDSRVGTIPVRWFLVADRLNLGRADPQLLAVMTMAMHDALNAITPRYPRWAPATTDEPAAAGADPIAAMSMAAFRVLAMFNPPGAMRAEAEPLLFEVLRNTPPPAQGPSLALGNAVGGAALARRASPITAVPFPTGSEPGNWRPTVPPPVFAMVSNTAPILFDRREALHGGPPPALGSERYLRDLAEVRRMGPEVAPDRSAEQTEIARFWAAQSGQRGFPYLAVRLMERQPPQHGAWDEAWLLSTMTVSLADSATLAWEEKRAHAFWRPVTAINLGSEGVPADPNWRPYLETPMHPDYPSGHASDCATGAGILAAVFGTDFGPVEYIAMEPAEQPRRSYRNFAEIAAECANSRVYAGVHFRFANEEGQRIGGAIARRAMELMAPLP